MVKVPFCTSISTLYIWSTIEKVIKWLKTSAAEPVNLKPWSRWSPKAEPSRPRWLAEVVVGHQAARSSSVPRLHAGWAAALRSAEPCQGSQRAKIPKLTLNLGVCWDETELSCPRIYPWFSRARISSWLETPLKGQACSPAWHVGAAGLGREPGPSIPPWGTSRLQGDTEPKGWWHGRRPGGNCCRGFWRVVGVAQVCWGKRISSSV